MKVRSSKVTNMTVGSPVRLILAFAVPMFIGNVFQQAYSMVDTMIAGRFLGEQAIAAIGATATLYSLLMNITWGLNNGYCVVLSREFGAGDMGRFRRSVAAMIALNAGIALVLTALSVGLLRPMMQAVFALGSVAVTEPVIWCLCAAFLAAAYVTVGHQKGEKHET